MLFQKSTKRFNPGAGTVLTKKKNPCYYNKNITTYNLDSTFSLKQNMLFCMIPKEKCSSCR